MFYSPARWFSFKWWLGFIPGTVFLLWCIFVFALLRTNQGSEGLGYALTIFTGGLLFLITLVMLGLGCFRTTYPISVGLAGPLLVPDAALIFIGIVLANQGGQGFSLRSLLVFLLYVAPGLLALLILVASLVKFPPSPRLEKP